jgi:hypothetical protein
MHSKSFSKLGVIILVLHRKIMRMVLYSDSISLSLKEMAGLLDLVTLYRENHLKTLQFPSKESVRRMPVPCSQLLRHTHRI